jgi:hypothetical protein
MKNVKLTIVGGGLNEFKNPYFFKKNLNDNKSIILRESALRGILCYLSGETDKADKIDDISIDDAINSRKVRYTKPKFDMYSSRYNTSIALLPSVPLDGVSLDLANNCMELSKKEISSVFKTDLIEEIYNKVNKEKIFRDISYRDLARAKKASLDLNKIDGKFWKTLKERLDAFVSELRIKVSAGESIPFRHKTENTGFFTEETLDVFCLICKRASIDEKYKLAMSNSSIRFLTNTPKSKDYVAGIEVGFATSGVGFQIKTNIEVFLQISDNLFKRMVNGPGSAFWGHNGLVEFSLYSKEELDKLEEKDVYWIQPIKKEKK